MKDMVPKGTGNSRLLRSNIPADTSHDQLVSMLRAGTFPFDFAGLNDAGIAQQGTPLNKATLLRDETVAKLGIPGVPAEATVDDALMALSGGMVRTGDIQISMQKEPLPGWYKCDRSLVENTILKELLPTPLDVIQADIHAIISTNAVTNSVPFICNDHYFICDAVKEGKLFYSENIAGPYSQLYQATNCFPWVAYDDATKLYFVLSYNSSTITMYSYVTLSTVAAEAQKQQVFTASSFAALDEIGVVKFKGAEYVFVQKYPYKISINPPSLIQQNQLQAGTNSYKLAAHSDDMLVLAMNLTESTLIQYTTDMLTWTTATLTFDISWTNPVGNNSPVSLQNYSLSYSIVLKKWIAIGYHNGQLGDGYKVNDGFIRIYASADITNLGTEYVDIVIPRSETISIPHFIDVNELACILIPYAKIYTKQTNAAYADVPYYAFLSSTDGITWELHDICLASSSSFPQATNKRVCGTYDNKVLGFVHGTTVTSGSSSVTKSCLKLLDLRKRTPDIANGFIKGGS